MKIQQFIIILLFSVVLGQFSTNILNGFGNNSHIIPPSSESMGNMWMFNNKANGSERERISLIAVVLLRGRQNGRGVQLIGPQEP